MGLIDRFKPKNDAPLPPTSPRGDSGRRHYGGFLDLEELNATLRGRDGLAVYDKMFRTDPDVRRNVQMIVHPIAGGTWSVEPAGGDGATEQDIQIADDLAWSLGLNGYSARPVRWASHLAQALPVLIRSGFVPFEQTWEVTKRENRTLMVPAKLGLRLPRSIRRWILDEYGELERLEQWRPSHGDFVELPRDDLLYYRVGAEGDNYEGISMLRPVYKPWLLKDKIERLDAIGQEREAVGLPVVYPPPATSEQVIDDLEGKLRQLRGGELAYLIMPGPSAQDASNNGWRFEIEGLGGSSSRDPHSTLSYHRDAISAAFISEFMRLGHGQTGARATAQVQQDPFLAGCEALAGIIEEEANRMLVSRFVALNYGDAVDAPVLRMSLVDSTSLAELAQFVQGLTTAGAMHPDEKLEDYLRERADLPPADEKSRKLREQDETQQRDQKQTEWDFNKRAAEAQLGNGPKSDQQQPGNQETQPPQDKQPQTLDDMPANDYGRELRPFEQLMCLDQAGEAINQARAAFEAAGAPVVHALANHLAHNSGGKEPTPPKSLVTALAVEMDDLVSIGRMTVAEELARQRGETTTLNWVDDTGGLPRKIHELVNDLKEKGHPAPYAVAVAQAKKFCAKGHADWCAAVAQWEKMKAQAHADNSKHALDGEGDPAGDAAKAIARRAALAAAAIVHAVYQAVERLAVNGTADKAALEAAARDAGMGMLRAQANAHAAGALNAGREAEAQDHADEISGVSYTSILDRNRCLHCDESDDNVIRSLNDPVRIAHKPPNALCASNASGTNRCRCMEFYILKSEAPAALEMSANTLYLDLVTPDLASEFKNFRLPPMSGNCQLSDSDDDNDSDGNGGVKAPDNGNKPNSGGGEALNPIGSLLDANDLTATAILDENASILRVNNESGETFALKCGNGFEHVTEEIIADNVYAAMGVNQTPSLLLSEGNASAKLANYAKNTKWFADTEGVKRENAIEELRKGFVLDALIANRKIADESQRSVLVSGDGTVTRFDNGDSLRFRAQGGLKSNLTADVSELWTMREGEQSNNAFKTLSWSDIQAQAQDVVDRREVLMGALPADDRQLRNLVEKRIDWLADHVASSTALESNAKAKAFESPTTLDFIYDQPFTLSAAKWEAHMHPRDHDGRFRAKIGGMTFDLFKKYGKTERIKQAIGRADVKESVIGAHGKTGKPAVHKTAVTHVSAQGAAEHIQAIDSILKKKGLHPSERQGLKRARVEMSKVIKAAEVQGAKAPETSVDLSPLPGDKTPSAPKPPTVPDSGDYAALMIGKANVGSVLEVLGHNDLELKQTERWRKTEKGWLLVGADGNSTGAPLNDGEMRARVAISGGWSVFTPENDPNPPSKPQAPSEPQAPTGPQTLPDDVKAAMDAVNSAPIGSVLRLKNANVELRKTSKGWEPVGDTPGYKVVEPAQIEATMNGLLGKPSDFTLEHPTLSTQQTILANLKPGNRIVHRGTGMFYQKNEDGTWNNPNNPNLKLSSEDLGAYLDREFPDSLGSEWEMHDSNSMPDVPPTPPVEPPKPPKNYNEGNGAKPNLGVMPPNLQVGDKVQIGPRWYEKTAEGNWWTLGKNGRRQKGMPKGPITRSTLDRLFKSPDSWLRDDEQLQKFSLGVNAPILSGAEVQQEAKRGWQQTQTALKEAVPRLQNLGLTVDAPDKTLSAKALAAQPELHGEILNSVADFIEQNPEVGEALRGFGRVQFASSSTLGDAPNPGTQYRLGKERIRRSWRREFGDAVAAFAAAPDVYRGKSNGTSDQIEIATGANQKEIEAGIKQMLSAKWDVQVSSTGKRSVPDDPSHLLRINGVSAFKVITEATNHSPLSQRDFANKIVAAQANGTIPADAHITWNDKPVNFNSGLTLLRRADGITEIYRQEDLSGNKSDLVFNDTRPGAMVSRPLPKDGSPPWTVGQEREDQVFVTAVHECGHLFASQFYAPRGESKFENKRTFLQTMRDSHKLPATAISLPAASGWDWFRRFKITPDEIRSVSGYSSKNANEAFAEMFSAYHIDRLPADTRLKFGALLEFMKSGEPIAKHNPEPVEVRGKPKRTRG